MTKKGGLRSRVTRREGNFGARVTKRENFGARVTKKNEIPHRITQKSNVGTRITKKHDSGNRDPRQINFETMLNKRPRFGRILTKKSDIFDCSNIASWFRRDNDSFFRRCATFSAKKEDMDQAGLALTNFLMNYN